MRTALLDLVRCPACAQQPLHLVVTGRDEREIRAGVLFCRRCSMQYPIQDGIVDLLYRPSAAILSEQAGWAELSRPAPDQDRIALAMPYLDDPHWRLHAANFDGLLRSANLAGACVLDLGAGPAWSSRRLLANGAAEVVALDILRKRYIGLETAEIYFQHEDIYFERVLGDMEQLPFGDERFDVVFATAALHHAERLTQALDEVYRVLRSYGRLVLVNEPVRPQNVPLYTDQLIEVQHGINEHIYTIDEWITAIESVGLEPRLLFPAWAEQLLQTRTIAAEIAARPPDDYLSWLFHLLPGNARLVTSQAILYNVYRDYEIPLVCVATKSPGRRSLTAYWSARERGRLLRAIALAGRRSAALPFDWRIERHTIDGTYPIEQAADGRRFFWTRPSAELVIRKPRFARTLHLALMLPPAPRTLILQVNDVRLDPVVAGDRTRAQEHVLRYDLPNVPAGDTRIRLTLDRGWCPADDGLGDDRRMLGVAVLQLGWR